MRSSTIQFFLSGVNAIIGYIGVVYQTGKPAFSFGVSVFCLVGGLIDLGCGD